LHKISGHVIFVHLLYERTPDLADYNYKSLSGQPRLIFSLSCCRALLRAS